MSTGQRIIKSLAVAFGLFLTFTIFFSIVGGLYAFTSMFSKDNVIEENTSILLNQSTENIKYLDIDVNSSNLVIKPGNSFIIETNNKHIKYKIDNNELKIKEEGYHLTNSKLKSELIITIPDTNLNEIDINTGAGNLNIDSINTEKLDIDLGTGTTLINNLYSKRADIDTGEKIIYIYEGHKEWEGNKDDIFTSTNERLNSFIFASDLFRKVKEVEIQNLEG